MYLYVASSWRNLHQPKVVATLRNEGHAVYDFRNPPRRTGFAWSQLRDGLPGSPQALIDALRDPIAEASFRSDMGALMDADAVVFVAPAGVSAALELGYAVGARKPTIVYFPEDAPTQWEPELMFAMARYHCVGMDQLLKAIRSTEGWLRETLKAS